MTDRRAGQEADYVTVMSGGIMSFFRRNKQGITQYANYTVVGICCAAIDLLVLNLLLVLFPSADTTVLTLFNTIAYTAAVTNSYYWNSKFTFKVKKTRKQLIPFILQAAASLAIANAVFIGGLWAIEQLSLFPRWISTNIAKGLSMYLSFLSSFFFNKYFVFRPALQAKEKEKCWNEENDRRTGTWRKSEYSQNSR
ncbi:GtrA family protein [Indiicoccus explosivorum]|uniref:GtrA family protein n=1 Tax=Indiicoccus explosivorum TaxID=1917864 RepID=UPI001F4DBC04|nr:GtrA family protein [Indiicoccus explosivorum]